MRSWEGGAHSIEREGCFNLESRLSVRGLGDRTPSLGPPREPVDAWRLAGNILTGSV